MKKVLFSLLLTAAATAAFCQPPPPPPAGMGGPGGQGKPGKEKIEAMKVAFISNQLSLTPEEAKVFWPLFDKFEEERKVIRKGEEPVPLDVMKDEQVGKFIQSVIDNKQKDLDLFKKYIPEFKKVLPERKVAKLLTLDAEFKKMLLMHAKGDGPNNPGSPKQGGSGSGPAWKGE